MATVNATITNMRIDDQALALHIAIDGDPGGIASAMMYIYDAAGTELSRSGLGPMEVGQQWDARLDMAVATHGDGDYAVWVEIDTATVDEQPGPVVRQGISFLVGGGRIYPSREPADERRAAVPPTVSPLRLEENWVVFDMTNHEAFDVEVAHDFAFALVGSGNYQRLSGQELVRAGATQQAHYLLPAGLADGRYEGYVHAGRAGSDDSAMKHIEFQVEGTTITQIPSW
jgi:hypothetical protein